MQAVQEAVATLFGSNLPSVEQIDALSVTVNRSEAAKLEFKAAVEHHAAEKAQSVASGIGLYIIGKYREAVDKLSGGRESVTKFVFLGRALRACRRYEEAIEAFEMALKQKGDLLKVTLEKAETQTQAGKLDDAKKTLKTLSNFENVSASYHYQQGRVQEAMGCYTAAEEQYKAALGLEPRNCAAMFRLAYLSDLLGSDEQAIEYYKQITAESPVYISALMNLAVLYEDAGDYDKASKCVQMVLNSYPNHAKAILFKKDIESAKTMVYDDEKERKLDRRNKLLETPITDFELSVRSRNCLRKMNIKTLGDLLKISEAELLAYKNFGETSLREIRSILESKNLRLGMALEDKGEALDQTSSPNRDNMSDILNKSVDDISLSVRSRKCLERLNVTTIGELISKTEAELLGCKNFGVTSLNEIKGKLADLGMSLRKLD